MEAQNHPVNQNKQEEAPEQDLQNFFKHGFPARRDRLP
jgi:hypothetical protein